MINFKQCFIWTIFISTLNLIAGDQVNDTSTKELHQLPPHVFPLNLTALMTNQKNIELRQNPLLASMKSCWPNTSDLWVNFLHSHSNIPKELHETLHFKMMSEHFHHHVLQIAAHIVEINDLLNENKTQEEIPQAAEAVKNESSSSTHPIEVTPLCWSNMTEPFWMKNLNATANVARKRLNMLRKKFSGLNRNFTDQMILMITTADEISNLTNFDAVQEELWEAEKRNRSEANSTKKASIETHREALTNNSEKTVKNESFLKSAIIPILLTTILILLTSNAILFRKLRRERYKDTPILLQDEIMNRFYEVENAGRIG